MCQPSFVVYDLIWLLWLFVELLGLVYAFSIYESSVVYA
jgi:hypothetical protein